jgi:hypothetical protein
MSLCREERFKGEREGGRERNSDYKQKKQKDMLNFCSNEDKEESILDKGKKF